MILARQIAIIGFLVHEVPALMPLMQEHVDDYEGVLPHLFIADVVRFIATLSPESPIPQDVLTLLECEWNTGDEEAQGLISVSLIEHVIFARNPREADLERWFGDGLKSGAHAIRMPRSGS